MNIDEVQALQNEAPAIIVNRLLQDMPPHEVTTSFILDTTKSYLLDELGIDDWEAQELAPHLAVAAGIALGRLL